MLIKILILLALATPCYLSGQDVVFSEEGKMGQSHLEIDTIFKSIQHYSVEGNEFRQLDSSVLLKNNLLQHLLPKYLSRVSDNSKKYFYLYNGSKYPLEFAVYSGFIKSVAYAQTEGNALQPISLYIFPECATGMNMITVAPGDILIFKTDYFGGGNFKTNAQLRLLTVDNQKIMSSIFPTIIDVNVFSIATEYKSIFYDLKKRITFLR
jgi:hypothetical protein